MPLIAIPNVSEGADREVIERLQGAASRGGASLLDKHSDAVHNRTVFTLTGTAPELVAGLAALAEEAAALIDLTRHEGAHPRVGCLDVCPLVPEEEPMERAIAVALEVAQQIVRRASLPVYLYGTASRREPPLELPQIRKGGLGHLMERCTAGFLPDLGAVSIDPTTGVVCVGARDVLVAFNVWLDAPPATARDIARDIRAVDGGLPGVRALGLPLPSGGSQVSMNLVEPRRTGVEAALAAVEGAAELKGAAVTAAELVGLVPQRFMPDPDAKATRLLIQPGRSLEAALELAGR